MTEAVTRHDPHAFTRYIMGLLVGTASYTLCLTLFWSTEATLKKWLIAYAISAFHGLGITGICTVLFSFDAQETDRVTREWRCTISSRMGRMGAVASLRGIPWCKNRHRRLLRMPLSAVGYHRLLSHRSFKCYLWVEYALALMGMCGGQHTPIMWVSANVPAYFIHYDE